MKKRILVIGDFISGSGLTQVVFNVFGRFPTSKYEISAVGYGSDPEKLTDKKCKKLGWKLYRVVPVTKKPINHWRWWKEFFKEHSYDAVYFNYSSSWNYLPVVYARRYGKVKKIICHSHNSYFSHEFSSKILMKILTTINNHGRKIFQKYADAKIATSKEAAMWMFGETKDVIISINGIDIPKFAFSATNRDSIREQLGISKDTQLVGFVGVLQQRKNPIFALEVFATYHKDNPNSKFLMLGKGPLKGQVSEKIKELELQDSVIQYDFAADVNRWYSAMDALLFPSMYEGLSLVALEAQVSNLPILASNTNVDDVFATSCIKKMHDMNGETWTVALEEALKSKKNRNYLDDNIMKFSVDNQSKEIEKLV
ncbi:glycosyltransferase [Limosilactobacillus oris]|uniref:glycosyltransferase n=1 Tax=Limosilactobacillus oris TaxID=1632 RepID=UPI0021B1DCE6|nr:glycosyltransferase [Limosilactobacillus oris]UXC67225.1 glycosyltransferase [Limosilactobacillus oris]